MATSIKISQLPAKGSNLEATDLLEVSEFNGTGYVSKSITGAEIVAGATTGFVPYVGATQDLELGANELYTGKLWLYDAVNDNYGSTHYTDGNYHIEDADGHKLLVIEDGFMQIHKTDTIQSNLFTSGLTATRDHYLPDASGTIALTWDLAGYVPTSRTLTINGVTQDLTANRTFTISTGITIGTTAITSGTVGRVLFEGAGNVVQESGNLFWDNTNGRLGIGTSSPISKLHIVGDTNIIYQQASTTGFTGKLYYAFKSGGVSGEAMSLFGDFVGGVASAFAFSNASGTTIMQIRNGGNVQIGTTTDAGFKLDVNGTARVVGATTITNAVSMNAGTNFSLELGFNVNARMQFGFLPGTGHIIQSLASGSSTTEALLLNHFGGNVIVGSGVGISTSAKFQITSTTQGFLPPRMTTTQKNAIASPAAGLMVYDTTLNLISVYNGTTWISL